MITSAFVLIIAGLLIIVNDYRTSHRESEEHLAILSNLLGYNAAAAVAFSDRETAAQALQAVAKLPNILEATITLPNGEIFSSYTSSNPLHTEFLSEKRLDYTQLRQELNRDRKSTRLNSSHSQQSRMPSSA